MQYLVENLIDFVGASSVELTCFSDLFIWFITLIIGVELVLFVLDGIFYTVRNVTRGIK